MASRIMNSVDIQLFLDNVKIDTPFKHIGILENETGSTLGDKINYKLTCLKESGKISVNAKVLKVTVRHPDENILMLKNGQININDLFDESSGTDLDCSDPDVFNVYLVTSTGGSRRKSRRHRKSRKSRR